LARLQGNSCGGKRRSEELASLQRVLPKRRNILKHAVPHPSTAPSMTILLLKTHGRGNDVAADGLKTFL
jgi:hypothetical protein